jgi:hypothetical protein
MNTLFKTLVLTLSLLLLVACGSESRSKTQPPYTPNSNLPDTTGNGTAESDAPSSEGDNGINEAHETSASIDVLVLYDNEVAEDVSNVAALVQHHFAVANNAYADSGLDINVNVVGIVKYNAQSHPALEEIAESEKVANLRDKYHADTVLIYQILRDAKVGDLVQCGVAYRVSSYEEESYFRDAMFAQVEINCPSNTTVHELGHNMGLNHSHAQDGDNAVPFPYGLGHGVDEKFVTIMAYGYLFNTDYEILKFSSPEYECLPGYPCGVAVGQSGEAHASKVLEYITPKIANLY